MHALLAFQRGAFASRFICTRARWENEFAAQRFDLGVELFPFLPKSFQGGLVDVFACKRINRVKSCNNV
ncbi:hypothetical protein sS8_0779 [Methylocaldum marinum]|uniref:Uncharacterized protein n=2 Tax=Methylocaldum marinum TaxID=1432792 RepID=A0A250KMG4_9GAMM|nr:hypothetical protein sS8_0779 [Methylocaldum marinum]